MGWLVLGEGRKLSVYLCHEFGEDVGIVEELVEEQGSCSGCGVCSCYSVEKSVSNEKRCELLGFV